MKRESNVMEKQMDRRKFVKCAIGAGAAIALASLGTKKILGLFDENNDTNIQNYFYDSNNGGIDDTFETQVENSEALITELSQLESYIKIVLNNDKIYDKIDDDRKRQIENFYISQIAKNEVLADTVLDKSTSLEYLNNEISRYNELDKDIFDSDELIKLREKLYCCFLIINNEIRVTGYDKVADFGISLIKSIVVNVSDNSISINDVTIRPATGEHFAIINYEKDGVTNRIKADGGLPFSIINKIHWCQKQSDKLKYSKGGFDGTYNKDRLEGLLEAINVYKQAFDHTFYVDNEFLSPNNLILSSQKNNSKSL